MTKKLFIPFALFTMVLSVACTKEGGDIKDPEPTTEYSITVSAAENGEVAVTVNGEAVTKAVEGAEISVKAIPTEGYEFVEWVLMGATLVDATANPATFAMPAAGITVEAEFADLKYYDKGVVIDGVRWATRNVDMPGTFAATPESPGLYYQWGRQTGWSATNPTKAYDEDGEIPGATWDATDYVGDEWRLANDPCPEGWRLPVNEEIEILINTTNGWKPRNEVNGSEFGTGDDTIFLPAAGYIMYKNGTMAEVDVFGMYWVNAISYSSFSYRMSFGEDGVAAKDTDFYRSYGFSLRCVSVE
jgi:uncharacterized protein (TIGR02145 family)